MTKLNHEMRRRWEKTKPQKESPGRGEREDPSPPKSNKKKKPHKKKWYRLTSSPEKKRANRKDQKPLNLKQTALNALFVIVFSPQEKLVSGTY